MGQVLSLQGCGVVLKPTRAVFESRRAGHSALGTWRRHSSSWERAFLMTRPHEVLGQKKGLNKEEFAANTLAKKGPRARPPNTVHGAGNVED